MKRITKLTSEMQASFTPITQEYIAAGLSCEPADWEASEKAIAECYQFAGLKPPKRYVRVGNPLVLAVAGPLATKMLCNGGAVYGVVRDAVGGAVYGVVRVAIRDAIRDVVRVAIRDAIRNAVDGAIRDVVDDAVGVAIDGAIHDVVRDAVGGAVDDAVGGAVYRAIHAVVRGVVRDAVGGAVDDAVGGAVRDVVSGNWHKYLGGRWWLAWQAYLQVYRRAGLKLHGDLWARADAYERAQRASGWWWPHKEFVLVCDAPEYISLVRNKLHAEGKPAIKYRDGWGLWFLNGVAVSQEVAESKPETWNKEWLQKNFISERSVDVRAQILKRMGVELFTQRMGAKVIDKMSERNYELLEVNLGGETKKAKYLKMLNPSVEMWHIEPVPDECKTVREAAHARKPPMLRELPVDDEKGDDWMQQGDVCVWPQKAKRVKFWPKVLT